ncbi:hypothetical protein A8L34_23110 [Bacillus sp. FJAT-27264]|uniref:DoxX family protein n=1 Tax=Paenibacillus sp. (strain DSM 101736 / FJAT-27264) TaxID=1850362 RepID=UPI000807FEDC|nr:DoxX family protein [Bacillus sp. FJAT-27264]OBZ09038.1 hypothetical protein A8L34_23110 [Bacillus sp. FJAT-27264]
MNIALWIAQGLLAVMFLLPGLMKLFTKPKPEQNLSVGLVKFIGIAEVLGAIGLILPGALNIAPYLTGVAAIGTGIIMLLAITYHLRRKETSGAVTCLVLLLISLFVVIGRFGIQPF